MIVVPALFSVFDAVPSSVSPWAVTAVTLKMWFPIVLLPAAPSAATHAPSFASARL